jgi:hypothetical protein
MLVAAHRHLRTEMKVLLGVKGAVPDQGDPIAERLADGENIAAIAAELEEQWTELFFSIEMKMDSQQQMASDASV